MENTIKKSHTIRDQLFDLMMDSEGSDMYLTVGSFPAIKIGGDIAYIDEGIERFKEKDTRDFTHSVINTEQFKELEAKKNLDFSFTYLERRFRCNISYQMGKLMLVFRLLNTKLPDLEDLGLTDTYKDVCRLGQGLILITGPTGSGKTTTLAAMINYINENYSKHIITIEDPVEYIHKHKKSIIEHKEVGKDIYNYETGLMGAMRQNPDIILFGEMRNKEEMGMALKLAETGHLVFSTLHTRSAYQTITRILDTFSPEEQNQVRYQLADSLQAVFSQRLLKSTDGTGVKMVKEILIKNQAIANLIRENDLHQIPTTIQMGQNSGMQLLEDDIIQLINSGVISEEEGLKYANTPQLIKDSIN